jgi:cytochrome b561
VAKIFHWSVAGLIFAQLALGWMAVAWPLTPTKLDLFIWHKSLGFIILLLVLLRLAWRFYDPPPRFLRSVPDWRRRCAESVHGLLYVVLILLTLSGWLFNSATGIPFRFFGWFRWPALIPPNRAQARLLVGLHVFLGWSLVVLLSIHILAALWHQLISRDPTLKRMLPGFRLPRETP